MDMSDISSKLRALKLDLSEDLLIQLGISHLMIMRLILLEQSYLS